MLGSVGGLVGPGCRPTATTVARRAPDGRGRSHSGSKGGLHHPSSLKPRRERSPRDLCPWVPDRSDANRSQPFPWHRFPQTSGRLAEILHDLGHTTRITEDVEAGLAAPGRCDVLVVNIGNPTDPRPADRLAAAYRGLADHLEAGRGLLGVHVSATSVTEMAEWPTLLAD
jgi:hypothetical protein